VKRVLLRSAAFVRAARRIVKRDSRVAGDLRQTLELLADDAFQQQLRTHKLKGPLEGFWACSAGYDLRIVFRLVQQKGTEAILLESVGTHEEVY
jgi:addiction module RelE/StbE family toxin